MRETLAQRTLPGTWVKLMRRRRGSIVLCMYSLATVPTARGAHATRQRVALTAPCRVAARMRSRVSRSVFVGLFAFVLLSGATLLARAAADPEFGAYWHDGKAELDGYRLTMDRYDHPRHGRCVAIYVTEPFSRSQHVKLDDYQKVPSDALDVLKLNLVRDFQTGIYDYHTIVSLFANSADFAPIKIAFSSSEWCGQVYEEMNALGPKLTQRVSSYFEGESAVRDLENPVGGVHEDDLFILLRGLRGPYLAPGEKRTRPFLASPFFRRLAHRPTSWSSAVIERLARAETIAVPAGSFLTDVFIVRPADGREGRFYIERTYPHRVVRWMWKPAPAASPLGGTDAAELTGSTRLEYWKTHDLGDEKYLERIGLTPAVR